ncbi:MAG: FliH/SctL family protein [Alphaproteobacteria bacterium]|nr:FliH/SctL family protein [Alphaproteobacteria bacterium]
MTNPAPNDARKFLFDLAFDSELPTHAPKNEKPPVFTQEQIEEFKKQAYSEGFSDGQAAAEKNQTHFMNMLLSNLEKDIVKVLEGAGSRWDETLAQAQEIALVIARKVIPTYTSRYGMDEIGSIVSKVFNEVSREPRLVFRVPENLFDAAKEKIESLSATAAYAGKLVILGDPDIGVSECRIEWADGGIERDLRKVWAAIDHIMDEVQTTTPMTLSSPEEPEAGHEAKELTTTKNQSPDQSVESNEPLSPFPKNETTLIAPGDES